MIKRLTAVIAFSFLFMANAHADMDFLIELAKQNNPKAFNSQNTQFNYVEFPSQEVDQYLLVADENSGVPSSLQGLWWMDGNPLPDEVVSFGGSSWNSWFNTTTVDVYGSGVWTWHTSDAGFNLFKGALGSKLTYRFKFNQEITFARITPVFNFSGFKIPVPRFIAEFTMTMVKDGLWTRETKFFGQESDPYQLRRIVKGNGEREDTYYEFLENAPESLFIPVN